MGQSSAGAGESFNVQMNSIHLDLAFQLFLGLRHPTSLLDKKVGQKVNDFSIRGPRKGTTGTVLVN